MSDLSTNCGEGEDRAVRHTTGTTDPPAGNEATRSLGVRLLQPGSRPPVTPIEQAVVSALKHEVEMDFGTLVERVASELYFKEIRSGAWMLDLGLFGSGLFIPDVVRERQAGNGTLWEITG